MNKEDLREVSSQLEALDSLAKLFKNLWFSQIKKEVMDEKVKAYLLVFEDAFPAMNHLVEYVQRSSALLVDGQLEELQKEFENLSRNLLNREVDIIGKRVDAEEAPVERQDQGIIDSLFKNQESTGGEDAASGEVLEGLLGNQSRMEPDLAEGDVGNILSPEEREEEDLSALWDEDVEEEDESTEDLDALLEDTDEEEELDEDEIEGLFEEESNDSSEDEGFDLDEMMDGDEDEKSEQNGIGISDDEMAALLDEEEAAALPQSPPKAPKKAAKKTAKGKKKSKKKVGK